MDVTPENVGKRLEAIRIAHDFAKKDFAALIQLDPSSYSKTIKGAKRLLAEHAYIVAERFNVPMDFIYRGKEADVPYRVIVALNALNESEE